MSEPILTVADISADYHTKRETWEARNYPKEYLAAHEDELTLDPLTDEPSPETPWGYMAFMNSEGLRKCLHCCRYRRAEDLLWPTGKEFSTCHHVGGAIVCAPMKPICRKCYKQETGEEDNRRICKTCAAWQRREDYRILGTCQRPGARGRDRYGCREDDTCRHWGGA